MFFTFEDDRLPWCDVENEDKHRWNRILFESKNPLILLTETFIRDGNEVRGTFLQRNIDDLVETSSVSFKRKIQLLMPREDNTEGWSLHEITHITSKIANPVGNNTSETAAINFIEFRTVAGETLTFRLTPKESLELYKTQVEYSSELQQSAET